MGGIQNTHKTSELKQLLEASPEETRITRTVQDEVKTTVDRMTEIVGASGEVLVKAQLFDEDVQKDNKISGTRVARILANYNGQVEESLKGFRESSIRIAESIKKLPMGLPVSLSGISIFDTDVECLGSKEGTLAPH